VEGDDGVWRGEGGGEGWWRGGRRAGGAGGSAIRARARAEVAAGGAVCRRRQAVHEGGPHGGAELGQRERLGEEGFAGSQAHAILLDRGGAVRRHEEDLYGGAELLELLREGTAREYRPHDIRGEDGQRPRPPGPRSA